ncbi:MAG: glucosamine-6-phosphate deaminase, partial [Coprobacillaceae bacterium]
TEKRVNLSLTGGATPKRMYEIMAPFVRGKEYLNDVHYYNFDEISIKDKRYGLTMNTLKNQFYDNAELKDENIHELNTENYMHYDELLLEAGGLDLILCGIGADGHFCGNIPGTTKFGYETYSVDVKEGTEMFSALEKLIGEKPGGKAVTFGPKTVLGAKQVILFANGKAKASIVKKALEGDITENVPSSVLRLHPNLTVILDKEAASELGE